MTDSQYEIFLKEKPDAFIAFRNELTQESDRGCALYAAAYLDKAISDLLSRSLVMNKEIEKDLFTGTAPLSSFSSRINFAYYLGKLSPSMRRDLNLIRKIRNDFAHSAEHLTFESEKIANRCKELQYSYHDANHRSRGHFTAAACGILATIEVTGLLAEAPKELPDKIPTDEAKEEIRKQSEEWISRAESKEK